MMNLQMKRKLKAKHNQEVKQDGDEDGPATCDEDEGAEQKEVSDEDPVSEPEQVGACASSSISHRPNIAWNA